MYNKEEEREYNDTIQNIMAVELVDKLMMCYRNHVRPSDKDLVRAYEANINVRELERIMEMEMEEEEYEC